MRCRQRCTHTPEEQVGERRRELANKITLVSRDSLKPAFASAKLETGPGMKALTLDRLIPAATKAAPVIFSTFTPTSLKAQLAWSPYSSGC